MLQRITTILLLMMALIMSTWSSAAAQPAGGEPADTSTLPSPPTETQVKCTCRPCGCFEILPPPPPPPPPKPYKSYCPPPPAPYLNIIGQSGNIYPLIPSSSDRKFLAGGEKMVFLVSLAMLLNLGWLLKM